jgi:hypothetical protein
MIKPLNIKNTKVHKGTKRIYSIMPQPHSPAAGAPPGALLLNILLQPARTPPEAV